MNKDPLFVVNRTDKTVVTIKHDVPGASWEQWYLVSSDRHHDNTHCDKKLEKDHLDEVKDRRAGILDFGDLFCCMQGKWDPRRSMSQLPVELRVDNYLNTVVTYNADFYRPYAKNFAFVSKGNHEKSISDRHQFDLLQAFQEELQKEKDCQLHIGTYQGWVRLQFERGSHRRTFNLRYTHGYGGGGPVTKDLIQAQRQSAIIEGADIIVSGHTHDKWYVPTVRETTDHQGKPILKKVRCIKCGTYKNEWEEGSGWTQEKGHPPRVLGAWWLVFTYYRNDFRVEIREAE